MTICLALAANPLLLLNLSRSLARTSPLLPLLELSDNLGLRFLDLFVSEALLFDLRHRVIPSYTPAHLALTQSVAYNDKTHTQNIR